jgi:L-ribulose-5-phosphate 4-epimerase
MLEDLKERVCRLNKELVQYRLVTMTSGNVSGRSDDGALAIVKPSGVAFEQLQPGDMVVLELDGTVAEGKLKPSVDAETHLYIYRHMEAVRGIVHTHSPYATSFAARGEGIPCRLTAMADEFGGPIPVSEYAKIGGDEIGKEVVRLGKKCPAILMKNHGVFAVGPSPEEAFKAAVMCEDVAKTMHLAMVLGEPVPIPEEEIARAHRRYKEQYGQQ